MEFGVALLLGLEPLKRDSCDISKSISGRIERSDDSIDSCASHHHLDAFVVTSEVTCPDIHHSHGAQPSPPGLLALSSRPYSVEESLFGGETKGLSPRET